MKKMPVIVVISILVIFGAGCIRTTTYVKERADQQVSGNRGYLQGDIPPSAGETGAPRTRTITQIEIELPSYAGWTHSKTEDKEIWGNRGIIGGERRTKASFFPEATTSQKTLPQPKRKYTK